eukprot:jgi/Botrbrau1/19951/Bobra.0059s0067.2
MTHMEEGEPVSNVTSANQQHIGSGMEGSQLRPTGATILVTKVLTKSDVEMGRIVLPRLAVQTNLLPSLANKKLPIDVDCMDPEGRLWTFQIKEWNNGGPDKVVYILDKTATYLTHVHAGEGGSLILLRTPDGQMGIESNTALAVEACRNPRKFYEGQHAENHAQCYRNKTCTKPAGHAGFCDGPKFLPNPLGEGSSPNQRNSSVQTPATNSTSTFSPKQHCTSAEQSCRKKARRKHDSKVKGVSRKCQYDVSGVGCPSKPSELKTQPNHAASVEDQDEAFSGDASLSQSDSEQPACEASADQERRAGRPIRPAVVPCPATVPHSAPNSPDECVISGSGVASFASEPGNASPGSGGPTPQDGRPVSGMRFVRHRSKRQNAKESDDGTALKVGSGCPPGLKSSLVLVAKTLTPSDTNGRIILPRVAVEANLPFVKGYRQFSLKVKDPRGGTEREIVIKSWANGNENRRVYVLDQAVEYMRQYNLRENDCIGLCTDADGNLVLDHNTDEIRKATIRSSSVGQLALQALQPPRPGRAAALEIGATGACTRSSICTKGNGHPGFCSGARGMGDELPGPFMRRVDPDADGSETPRHSRNLRPRTMPFRKDGGGDNDAHSNDSDAPCERTPHCTKPVGHDGFCSNLRAPRNRPLPQVGLPLAQDQEVVHLGHWASNDGGKRLHHVPHAMPSLHERQPMSRQTEVTVTCESLTGIYKVSDGLISVRKAVRGKIITAHLTPPEFEYEAGCDVYPNWKSNILVDLGPEYRHSTTLGSWLHRRGIAVDRNGVLIGPELVSPRHNINSLQNGRFCRGPSDQSWKFSEGPSLKRSTQHSFYEENGNRHSPEPKRRRLSDEGFSDDELQDAQHDCSERHDDGDAKSEERDEAEADAIDALFSLSRCNDTGNPSPRRHAKKLNHLRPLSPGVQAPAKKLTHLGPLSPGVKVPKKKPTRYFRQKRDIEISPKALGLQHPRLHERMRLNAGQSGVAPEELRVRRGPSPSLPEEAEEHTGPVPAAAPPSRSSQHPAHSKSAQGSIIKPLCSRGAVPLPGPIASQSQQSLERDPSPAANPSEARAVSGLPQLDSGMQASARAQQDQPSAALTVQSLLASPQTTRQALLEISSDMMPQLSQEAAAVYHQPPPGWSYPPAPCKLLRAPVVQWRRIGPCTAVWAPPPIRLGLQRPSPTMLHDAALPGRTLPSDLQEQFLFLGRKPVHQHP